MGCEDIDINYNWLFSDKGDCTKRGEPTIVNYKIVMMISIKAKGQPLMEVMTYYANNMAPTIIPINEEKVETEVSR